MSNQQMREVDLQLTGLLNGEFTIPVYGAHQVKNALAAILIANEAGYQTDDMREALKSVTYGYADATSLVANNGALFINDAYNAAPTSMRAALAFHERNTVAQ